MTAANLDFFILLPESKARWRPLSLSRSDQVTDLRLLHHKGGNWAFLGRGGGRKRGLRRHRAAVDGRHDETLAEVRGCAAILGRSHQFGSIHMQKVLLFRAAGVSFLPAPEVMSRETRRVVAKWWDENKARFPKAFNGPLVGLHALRSAPDKALEVEWYATHFAHYLMRFETEPAVPHARVIFAGVVLITAEGTVVAGEMSDATVVPGRLQLPGGVIEMPVGAALSPGACINGARFELAEEVGLKVDASQLDLWRVKSGGPFGDVGFLYTLRFRASEGEIVDAFDRHVKGMKDAGQAPEFCRLHFLDGSDLPPMRHVDYLPQVVEEALGDFCR